MNEVEQSKWAAAHWRKLADEEEDRLKWDKHAIPSVVEARAKSYRRAADELDATREGRGRWVQVRPGHHEFRMNEGP